jgi:hypothetical protein
LSEKTITVWSTPQLLKEYKDLRILEGDQMSPSFLFLQLLSR